MTTVPWSQSVSQRHDVMSFSDMTLTFRTKSLGPIIFQVNEDRIFWPVAFYRDDGHDISRLTILCWHDQKRPENAVFLLRGPKKDQNEEKRTKFS